MADDEERFYRTAGARDLLREFRTWAQAQAGIEKFEVELGRAADEPTGPDWMTKFKDLQTDHSKLLATAEAAELLRKIVYAMMAYVERAERLAATETRVKTLHEVQRFLVGAVDRRQGGD